MVTKKDSFKYWYPSSLLPTPHSDRKVFLATWKEIPQSNEVQSTIDNVQLSPGRETDSVMCM